MTTKTPKIKLTKDMRLGFVTAVLADIKADLDTDTIRDLTMAEAVKALPDAVRKIYLDNETMQFVVKTNVAFDSAVRRSTIHPKYGHAVSRFLSAPYILVPGVQGDFRPSDALKAKVKKLMAEAAAKMDEKEALQERLTAMAGSCNNVEELEDMFPLLAKYIPKPVIVPKSMVPAVLIKDTMKELRRLGVPPKAAVAA